MATAGWVPMELCAPNLIEDSISLKALRASSAGCSCPELASAERAEKGATRASTKVALGTCKGHSKTRDNEVVTVTRVEVYKMLRRERKEIKTKIER